MSLQGKPVLMSLNNKALQGQEKKKFQTAGSVLIHMWVVSCLQGSGRL